ncbi:MAG: ATP-binding protein [Oscillospiraceae bacterium]|jgi:DNA replication protein DnaC|nr:ATP-binding protein [Oscillospiraceae bacterium]
MALDPVCLGQARVLLAQSKAAASTRLSVRRAEIYGALPAVRAIDEEMRAGLLRAVRDALSGEEAALERCRAHNLSLRARRGALLAAGGYPPDALDDRPACALCGDTGTTGDGRLCACLRQLCIREQRRALSEKLDMAEQTFAAFDLRRFSAEADPSHGLSPRDHMDIMREYCAAYVERFGPDSPNLLFRGGAGLGKTFLCACIAGALCERGHWVLYETAAGAFALMEAQKFARDENAGEEARRLLRCDLLILDDVGAEFSTPFAQAAFHQILSARLGAGRRTLLVSGLTEEELRGRYTPQITSRLEGFELLPFFGADLRRHRA